MTTQVRPLEWSGRFYATSQPHLTGDKILLPPSALEQLLAAAPLVNSDAPLSHTTGSLFDPFNPHSYAAERHTRAQSQYQQQQLPYPLTFRLVNGSNNRVVFAGIREFSAEEETAGLSPFLVKALGIDDTSQPRDTEDSGGTTLQHVTVHVKEIPKGTFVRLRPLEAGYDPEDWKSLLEEHMRRNFTTLSKGEILTVPAGREQYQFLIDVFKPEGDAICVVDTDLEVDIEALNEDQARETLKKITEKSRTVPNADNGSSKGGRLDLLKPQQGQVLAGEYVDYELPSWIRSSWLEVEIVPDASDDEDDINIFASPFSERQRSKPRSDEHVFGDFERRGSKLLRLSPTNVELENAEALWISVHAPVSESGERLPKRFRISAAPIDKEDVNGSSSQSMQTETNFDGLETICPNCHKSVPKQSFVLHENFCRRNNIACSQGCGLVFQRSSAHWSSHWHCSQDSSYGNTRSSLIRHNAVFHTEHPCPSPICNFIALTLPALAQHRTSNCPGKLILCSFCHLVVPQEGDPDGVPNAEALLSGLTPHELADGARTTECHLCSRIVRLRDMATHLKHHDLERTSRPQPRPCRNVNCGRTLDGASKSGDTRAGARMGQGAGNDIGLCSTCFGPLYVNIYDPEGKALRRRIERRYLSQLVGGCKQKYCRNDFCKTGRGALGATESLTTQTALPVIKPFVDGLSTGLTPLHFCVDDSSQNRRLLAEMMAVEDARARGWKMYALQWCVAALEAESGNLEKAREWLKNYAPAVREE